MCVKKITLTAFIGPPFFIFEAQPVIIQLCLSCKL